MWSLNINIKGPYRFERALQRLAADPLKMINFKECSLVIPLIIEGNPYPITVKSVGTLHAPSFQLSGEVMERHQVKVTNEIRRILQWDVSHKQLKEHFRDTDLHPLFTELEGTPLILDFDLYFNLMKSIIHQQLNLNFSHTLTARFVQTFGFKNNGVWFPPSPTIVSRLNYDDLTGMQFSRRKAEYIIDTSKKIASGELQLDTFYSLENEEIIDILTKIRGIGPWTAESLLLFGLGRSSIFPYADIGIQNGLKKLYQLDVKPTRAQMERWRKAWSPYETYAALYLWEFVGDDEFIIDKNLD